MDNLQKRECFVINGGRRLSGSVELHGAKNAVLPILVAATLSDDCVIVEDCPSISDVDNMLKLIEILGARVVRDGRRVCVYGRVGNAHVGDDLIGVMRSSMYVLGALLANVKEVSMPYPGGCQIGARPMDIHLSALERLGARCSFDGERLHCKAQRLVGGDIVLRYPSVGATENALICAVLAKGYSKIVNAAREPEIVSLARALRAMGARIMGEGTSVIFVEGVERLGGACVTPVADRIVCATLMCAVDVCGGEIEIKRGNLAHQNCLIDVLKRDGCTIDGDEFSLRISSRGVVEPCEVTTGPYPLFATDVQPQLLATRCFANGVSKMRETVFENRFAYVDELKRMGALIDVNGREAIIACENKMTCANMHATDLRGGAGLCIAALKTEGESAVFNTHYIDRGYEQIEKMFGALGADIKREWR